jgi:hypothetical protein
MLTRRTTVLLTITRLKDRPAVSLIPNGVSSARNGYFLVPGRSKTVSILEKTDVIKKLRQAEKYVTLRYGTFTPFLSRLLAFPLLGGANAVTRRAKKTRSPGRKSQPPLLLLPRLNASRAPKIVSIIMLQTHIAPSRRRTRVSPVRPVTASPAVQHRPDVSPRQGAPKHPSPPSCHSPRERSCSKSRLCSSSSRCCICCACCCSCSRRRRRSYSATADRLSTASTGTDPAPTLRRNTSLCSCCCCCWCCGSSCDALLLLLRDDEPT